MLTDRQTSTQTDNTENNSTLAGRISVSRLPSIWDNNNIECSLNIEQEFVLN